MTMSTQIAIHESPVGPIELAGDETGLRSVRFGVSGAAPGDGEAEVLAQTRRELDAYFAGTLRRFTVRMAPSGSAFQQAVWRQLQDIRYGTTISYGALAERLRRPDRVRAVGAANGRNPLPILIPCHRVIGADGSLTGYGGGLDRKAALLELEGRHAGAAGDPAWAFRQLVLACPAQSASTDGGGTAVC